MNAPAPGRSTVAITPDGWTTVADIAGIAHGAEVELTPAARARIEAGRAVVDRAVAAGTPVYGVNTGLGHARDQPVPGLDLPAYQRAIISSHASGIGEPLPATIVRAAMATRLRGLVTGAAGASLQAAEVLLAMLNLGVCPLVPSVGSVGAGDLMHMAAIAEVAIGHGEASYRGRVMDGARALALAGIRPLAPRPKDGLALVSANSLAAGHGALVARRLQASAELADISAALSLEATRGNLQFTEAAPAMGKLCKGQDEALLHLRALLAGSDLHLHRPGQPGSLRDPISFRVVPQVHGTLREFAAAARGAVEAEINGSGDNPLVALDNGREGRLLHNGNFCPVRLAVAMDAVRVALAHVAVISERRMSHLIRLWWDDRGWLASHLRDPEAARQAKGLLHYAATARLAELRHLAGPASLGVPPLDLNVEDHATAAPLTVLRTEQALDLLADVLAAELLMATLALRRRPAARLGAGAVAARDRIEQALRDVEPATPRSDLLHRIVRVHLIDHDGLRRAARHHNGDP